jgi:signal transduction histidine kinase
LKAGVSLVETLERIDPTSAGRVREALLEARPLAGHTMAKVKGSWRSLQYQFEPGKNGSDHVLVLSLAMAPADKLLSEECHRLQIMGSALAHVTSLLNRDMPAEDMARAVLPDIVSTVDTDTGAVLRVRGDGRAEVLAAYGPTRRRGFPYPLLELGHRVVAAAAQQPGLVNLAPADLTGLPDALRGVSPRGVRYLLIAPAFAGHQLCGLLVLGGRRDRPLGGLEADFLRVVADSIGLALDHAVMSRQSELSEVVLDTACAVARAISGSLDLEQTFQQIASSAARVMGNCSCLLLELRPEVDDLLVVACSGTEDHPLLGLTVRFEGKETTREALQDGRSIVVEDITWGTHVASAARKRLLLRSALFVPIRADGVLIGSLLLYSSERRDSYSSRDVARAEIVAEQAASAICNARLFRNLTRSQQRSQKLLRRLTRLRQEKRQEWANVLHDDIVQTMVAALYEVQGIQAELPAEANAETERVATLLRQAIADARKVIRDLRPPALDGLGLTGALQALVEQVGSEVPCDVQLHLSEVPALNSSVETSLYVIAREALHNAGRHSGARHVDLWLEARGLVGSPGQAVRLWVRDDGSGLPLDVSDRNDHFGLTMMDEQAALVGGELSIDSGPGRGTTVEVVVPVIEAKRSASGGRS